MKNKKLTYFLGVLVVGVWGMIVYRVFQVVGGDDSPVFQIQTSAKKEAFNDYDVPKDTAKLLLNYRDPFKEQKSDTEVVAINKPVTHTKPIILKPSTNWNIIKYTGFIHNPGSKKLIAMVSINGKEQMLAEGETTDQVKLLKNMKDSIKVLYQGNVKFIPMNTKNQ